MNDRDQLAFDAERIVSGLTGEGITQVQKIETGVMAFKYIVLSGSGHLYITRFYPPKRSFVVNYEPDIVKRCHEFGMRVPEVIGDSKTGPRAALEYMVYKMLPGLSMQTRLLSLSGEALQCISRDLMREMDVLGQIPIEGFGYLIDAEHGRFGSWISFMHNVFAEGIKTAKSSPLLPNELLEAIEVIGTHLERFSYSGPPSLCWGDISPENIILDKKDKFVGLIDFEGVLAVDRQLNHGYLRARYADSKFWLAFNLQWHANSSLESARSALYVIVRALRILPHVHEPLPTGTKRLPIEKFLPGLPNAIKESLDWVNGQYLLLN